ncbi:CAP domain-containing protein [Paraphysoderma sedebokerense]|nr:CAP domain-containing protein [Paraphysoderma sedebokerense]
MTDVYGSPAGLRAHRLHRRQGYSRPVTNDEITVLNLVNQERRQRGLSELCLDPKLMDSASLHSQDQARSGRMSHTGSDGSSPFTRIRQNGYQYRGAAENVAWNQASPQEVVNTWMRSSGHRANILNPTYTQMGIAVVNRYWTQVFAAPSNGNSKCPDTNQAPNNPPNNEAPTPPPQTETPSRPAPEDKMPPKRRPSNRKPGYNPQPPRDTPPSGGTQPGYNPQPPKNTPPSYGTPPGYNPQPPRDTPPSDGTQPGYNPQPTKGTPPSYGKPDRPSGCRRQRTKPGRV